MKPSAASLTALPCKVRACSGSGRASKARHDGSGLGLAIVTRLLDRMGSRLRIDAPAAGGSRFDFVLDLALAGEDELEPGFDDDAADIGGIHGDGRVILVVDDQPQSRDMLCDLLDGYGFECLPAANGEEALEALRHASPDLILTDQRMAGMDGWGLLLAVRQSHPGLPVLLYSSLPPRRPDDFDSALAFDGALLKPVGGRLLLEAIDRLLREHGEPASAVCVGVRAAGVARHSRMTPCGSSGYAGLAWRYLPSSGSA